jgi:2'-5' RNA ligase
VGGRERPRLFLAFQLPRDAVEALAEWQRRELRGGRIVPPENLHVTLAFLGARPAEELDGIAGALREAAAGADEQPVLTSEGYRETRSVGMVTCGDDEGRATRIAEDVFDRLEQLGVYERERRRWLPHVTVLRFRERPRLDPQLPDLGPVRLSEAAVYISVLRPSGAQYDVLESVALGG